jgi:hypothetical protein
VTQSWEVLPDYADGLGLDEVSAVGVLTSLHHFVLRQSHFGLSGGRPPRLVNGLAVCAKRTTVRT